MCEKVRLSARIQKELLEDVKRVADSAGLTQTAVVTLALRDYIARQDKKKGVV